MKNKVGSYVALAVSIILFVLFYFLSGGSVEFEGHVLYDVVRPAWIGSIFLAVASFVSIFMDRVKFRKWLIFTIIFILFSVWNVSITSDTGFLTGAKEIITWILGTIYLIVSLAIIVYQAVKGRKAR